MIDQPESPMGCSVGESEYVLLNGPIEVANLVAEFFSTAEESFHDWLLVTLRGHLHVPTLPVVLLLLLHLPHKVLGFLEEWQGLERKPSKQQVSLAPYLHCPRYI